MHTTPVYNDHRAFTCNMNNGSNKPCRSYIYLEDQPDNSNNKHSSITGTAPHSTNSSKYPHQYSDHDILSSTGDLHIPSGHTYDNTTQIIRNAQYSNIPHMHPDDSVKMSNVPPCDQ